jgi:hypothetical protein
VILCDLDGVLAVGPDGDAAPSRPIYRTFVRVPEALDQVRETGTPLHLVTARVGKEAGQILAAIGLDGHFDQVVAAEQLFWPTVRQALKRRTVPSSLSKTTYRHHVRITTGSRVVMIENHRGHLEEMLDSDSIDFGVLVPPVRFSEGKVVAWFDLDAAIALAHSLVFPPGGAGARTPARIFEIPRLSPHESRGSYPTIDSLYTGQTLDAKRGNVVSAVRAARGVLRRLRPKRSRG